MKKILVITLLCVSSCSAVELLIYDTQHWMDRIAVGDIALKIAKGKITQQEYEARHRRGDIVEVRPNGYWTGEKAKGFNKKIFTVLTVPAVKYKSARKYMEPYIVNGKIIKRRKYSIANMKNLSTGSSKVRNFAFFIDANLKDKSK